jgi:hypothetical protein
MARGPYRRWCHGRSFLAEVVLLKEEIEEASEESSDLQSEIKKMNKQLSKLKKILEDKKHRLSYVRSRVCRQLRKAAIIAVNNLAEMEEVTTMKNMGKLGAAKVKVRVATRVNRFEYEEMVAKARASGITVEQ